MTSLQLVPITRVDIGVRVIANESARRLERLGRGPRITDDDALELVAGVIADLVVIERYLTDPRVKWGRRQ